MEVSFTEAKTPPPHPANLPPPPAPEQRPAPTPEETKEATKELYKSMGWGEPPEAPAAKVQSQPEAEPEVTPAETEPEVEAPAPAVEAPTPHEIATETAREMGREIARELRRDDRPEHHPAPVKAPDLSPEDAEDLKVIRYLEREEPGTYRGMTEKFIDYVRKHYAYQSEWLTANPGKEFDPDEEVHTQWYADNSPDIEPKTIEQGRMEMVAEEKFEKKYGGRIKAMDTEKAIERANPTIAANATRRVHEMVTLVDPELAKLVTDSNGNPNLTEDTVKAVYDRDPIAAAITDKIAREELDPMILELEKTAVEDADYKFDARRNPIHAQITQFISQKERDLSRAPRSVQVQNGAQWIPLAEYNKRISEITRASANEYEARGRIDELNRSCWAISVDQIETLITAYCAEKAKRLIAEEDGRAKKKYLKTESGAVTPAKPVDTKPQFTPPNTSGKPRSPTLGGQSEISTVPNLAKGSQKSYGETAAEVNFR